MLRYIVIIISLPTAGEPESQCARLWIIFGSLNRRRIEKVHRIYPQKKWEPSEPGSPCLCVTDENPSYSLAAIGRHPVVLGNRCSRRGRAFDFPHAAFGAGFSRARTGSNGTSRNRIHSLTFGSRLKLRDSGCKTSVA